MLDVQKLERRWIKYKIKKYLPYIVSGIFTLLFILIYIFWNFSTVTPSDTNSTQATLAKMPPPSVSSSVIGEKTENTPTNLEPSMEFVHSFESAPTNEPPSTFKTSTAKPTTSQAQPINNIPAPPKTIAMPEYTPPPSNPSIPPKITAKENVVTINKAESKLDIEDLQERFKTTSNANLGLFIARYYYDKGNFQEAYNFALKTNSINNRIDESWIIFAKSLVKLGRSDHAKKTLQLYLQQSNSESARALLDSIDKGTFK